MNMTNDNVYLTGTSGKVYLNNEMLISINKISVKMTGIFEDFNPAGEYGTVSVYQGYTGEGTLEGAKINSWIDSELVESYQNGTHQSYTIYTSLTNPNTKATEKVKISGVQFTEINIQEWETKKTVTRSSPFKFRRIEYLSTIE